MGVANAAACLPSPAADIYVPALLFSSYPRSFEISETGGRVDVFRTSASVPLSLRFFLACSLRKASPGLSVIDWLGENFVGSIGRFAGSVRLRGWVPTVSHSYLTDSSLLPARVGERGERAFIRGIRCGVRVCFGSR